ncbi:glycosyltransferase family protein [Chondrinema litorale]|uniref:glycosyltransferase family protein n=1 Tax=Chondrinema litorale TaxID=2994555 RepID=UPI002542910A|nr:glycosyltransferase family protein [Chondrinema litorale]UZR93649.1 glycosyl transferase [Chondrinema litorale]
MKILYAVQGTGNGHLSRARDIIPELLKKGEVDILVSGTQAEVKLPYEIKYKMHGLGFTFGKKGGIDFMQTFNDFSVFKLAKEVRKVPVHDYDVIINDFEPVTAWASYFSKTPCIALSHQSAILSANSPKPDDEDMLGKLILKYYAPTKTKYGFHFDKFDNNITTPVIRQEIRTQTPTNKNHYTVYLPAFDDEYIVKKLKKIKDIEWHIFSKHNKYAYRQDNLYVQPIDNEKFIESLISCKGILCGAGFETPAEALYLEKKLMVLPMKKQYEQHCNAAALAKMGIPVINSLKKKSLKKVEDWVQSGCVLKVDYPNVTADLITEIFDKHLLSASK